MPEVSLYLYKGRMVIFPQGWDRQNAEIHMYGVHSFFKKKKKLLSVYYVPGIEATLRIKQGAASMF